MEGGEGEWRLRHAQYINSDAINVLSAALNKCNAVRYPMPIQSWHSCLMCHGQWSLLGLDSITKLSCQKAGLMNYWLLLWYCKPVNHAITTWQNSSKKQMRTVLCLLFFFSVVLRLLSIQEVVHFFMMQLSLAFFFSDLSLLLYYYYCYYYYYYRTLVAFHELVVCIWSRCFLCGSVFALTAVQADYATFPFCTNTRVLVKIWWRCMVWWTAYDLLRHKCKVCKNKVSGGYNIPPQTSSMCNICFSAQLLGGGCYAKMAQDILSSANALQDNR